MYCRIWIGLHISRDQTVLHEFRHKAQSVFESLKFFFLKVQLSPQTSDKHEEHQAPPDRPKQQSTFFVQLSDHKEKTEVNLQYKLDKSFPSRRFYSDS